VPQITLKIQVVNEVNINKADKNYPVYTWVSKLGEDALSYLFDYGVKQNLADACASVSFKDKDSKPLKGLALEDARRAARKAIQARIAALDKGEIPSGGGGGVRLSPEFVEVRIVIADKKGWTMARTTKEVKTWDDAKRVCGRHFKVVFDSAKARVTQRHDALKDVKL
jgi:hypothetical protein